MKGRAKQVILVVTDAILLNVAFILATLIRYEGHLLPLPAWKVTVIHGIFILIFFISFYLYGLYAQAKYYIFNIFCGISVAWIFIVVLTLFAPTYAFLRPVFSLFWLFSFMFITGWRLAVRYLLHIARRRLGTKRRVLIVGTGREGRGVLNEFRRRSEFGYEVVGFFNGSLQKELDAIQGVPVFHGLEDPVEVLSKYRIDEVVIALPANAHKEIWSLVTKFSGSTAKIKLLPDLYEIAVGRVSVSRLDDIPLIDLTPGLYGSYRFAKRIIDVIISCLGILLLSPVILISAIAIKLTSSGPIFYRQERTGRDRKPFTLYKFRSMFMDAEKETGPIWASDRDPRVTGAGRILRRTSLDEVPQLWNVLKGDMSLVGPRPERPFFVERHTVLQGKRLNVRPGITGLAQVNGRYNLTVRQKEKYDHLYLRNISFVLDLKILLKTLWVVLYRKGVR